MSKIQIKMTNSIWIIPLTLFIGFFMGLTINAYENVNLEINDYNCTSVNNNYAMFQFIDEEPTAQHKLVRVEFDNNCNLQNIYEWIGEENSFNVIYFRGYE